MPERRPSGAQADDIEDVKKVCFIFFFYVWGDGLLAA